MDWIEQFKISSTCWAASYDWEPRLFNPDWTLRCGPYEMGCFLKDYLYEKRNDDQPAGADEPSASSP